MYVKINIMKVKLKFSSRISVVRSVSGVGKWLLSCTASSISNGAKIPEAKPRYPHSQSSVLIAESHPQHISWAKSMYIHVHSIIIK